MTIVRAVAAAAWWLAVVAWIAAITAPGAAAMVAFTRLPELEVAIPSTMSYFEGDPEAAGRFVAGFVTNPIFVAGDSIRLGAALLAWSAIIVTVARPVGRGRATLVATLCLAIASVTLAASLMFVSGPLAESLEAWRTAVFADDRTSADAAKAIFDPLHEQASRLMQTELILLLIAAIAGGIASASPAAPPGRTTPGEPRP